MIKSYCKEYLMEIASKSSEIIEKQENGNTVYYLIPKINKCMKYAPCSYKQSVGWGPCMNPNNCRLQSSDI